ncbi:hypothetical protein [Sorangium sp. So ce394]|uniref:hypothetical protein n=1 Tax=Sorangium sp. So ce394 TaxID=3133310 RepID=UPI003F5C7412
MNVIDEPLCPKCKTLTTFYGCFSCQGRTQCGRCFACTNPGCARNAHERHMHESERLVGFDFGSPWLYPQVPNVQEQWLDWSSWSVKFDSTTTEIPTERDPPSSKTKRARVKEGEGATFDPNKRFKPDPKLLKVAKAGKGHPKKLSDNTRKLPPLSLGVATWNLNHINQAEEKTSTIAWIFMRHLWIDVLALQEVNLAGRDVLEKDTFVATLEESGLECRFGPLMRSFSAVGPEIEVDEEEDEGRTKGEDDETDNEGEDDDGSPEEDAPEAYDPGSVREETWSIWGTALKVRVTGEGEGVKLREVEVDMGWFKTWKSVRLGQPEYYPVVVRSRMFRKAREGDAWASYDGNRLAPGVHYWAKKPCALKLCELPAEKAPPIVERLPLKKPSKDGSVYLPVALLEELNEQLNKNGGSPVRTNAGTYVRSIKSTARSRGAPWVRKWVFTLDQHPEVQLLLVQMKPADDLKQVIADYEKTSNTAKPDKKLVRQFKNYEKACRQLDAHPEGQLVAYLQTRFWPAYCRPVVVHDLELLDPRGEKVSVGVVHTTPAGHGLKRQGEYEQLEGMFAYVGKAGGHWVLAGDYYLDPESTVVKSTKLNHCKSQLFESHLTNANLDLAISVSATNQTRLKGNAQNIQDRTTRMIVAKQEDGKSGERTVVVLNKRADFFAHSKTFVFRQAGIVAPGGGLLPLDFDHRALNWWSDISDHCPVGALLCTGERPQAWRRFEIQKLPRGFRSKIEEACDNVACMRRDAVRGISESLADLCELAKQRQAMSDDWTACLKSFCVLLSCVLNDPDLSDLAPKVPEADYEAFAKESQGLTSESLLRWLSYCHDVRRPTDERLRDFMIARLKSDPIDAGLRAVLELGPAPVKAEKKNKKKAKNVGPTSMELEEERLSDDDLRKVGQGWIDRGPASKDSWDRRARGYLLDCWVAGQPEGFEKLVGDGMALCNRVHKANRYLHLLNYVLGDLDLEDEDETYGSITPRDEESRFEPIPYIEVGEFQAQLLGLRDKSKVVSGGEEETGSDDKENS